MRTPLEIAIQLDELLKRSKPFRNFNEVFGLTAELISTLSPTEEVIEEAVIVEETVVEEPTVEEIVDETPVEETIIEETVTEELVVAKKTTKKK
jgi:hypothetical protein